MSYGSFWASRVALVVKNPPANADGYETQVQSLGREDLLEDSMATHSSIIAWRIPWTEEPVGLWSIGWQRVGHGWSDLADHTRGSLCDFWVSLVAQTVWNLPALQETQVWSLGQEDPLEKGMATHFRPGEFHGQRYSSWGHKESDTTEQLIFTLFLSFFFFFRFRFLEIYLE